MISHNEENKIARSLESLSFADEIIVADCSSEDKTAEIAEKYGARVFQRPNLVNLNVNKNFTFDQAKSDFILCLDADEVIPDETAREISEKIAMNPPESGFFLPRRNFWKGYWLKHGGHYPDRQLRLFRRERGRFPERHLHERLLVNGQIGKLKNPLDHFPYETDEECHRKLDFYTTFEAEHLLLKGAKPTFFTAFRFCYWLPSQRFFRRFLLKGGFLDGQAGWEAMKMDMLNFRLRYEKLRKHCEESKV